MRLSIGRRLGMSSAANRRVGAAQDLLIKDLDIAAIERGGSWKSMDVLARYLEKAERNIWI